MAYIIVMIPITAINAHNRVDNLLSIGFLFKVFNNLFLGSLVVVV